MFIIITIIIIVYYTCLLHLYHAERPMQDSYTDEVYSCDLGYFAFSIYSCISRPIPDYSCILSTQNDGISVSHNYNLNQSTQSHADASWNSVFEWFVMHYHMKSVQ